MEIFRFFFLLLLHRNDNDDPIMYHANKQAPHPQGDGNAMETVFN